MCRAPRACPAVVRGTLDGHLEELRDALDPENGIEEQYNPKHNKSYVWRGLRLLACEQLSGMADAVGEPFDALMIKLKLVKPPPAPAPAPAAGECQREWRPWAVHACRLPQTT